MAKKVIFIRHAESLANEKHVFGLDLGLSEKGKEQAEALGKQYGRIPCEVIVSAMIRTCETGLIAFPNAYKIVDKRFNEINFGQLEGAEIEDSVVEEIQKDARIIKTKFGGDNVFLRAEKAAEAVKEYLEKSEGDVYIIIHDTLFECIFHVLGLDKKYIKNEDHFMLWTKQRRLLHCGSFAIDSSEFDKFDIGKEDKKMLKKPVNYITKAVDQFMYDNGLSFNKGFSLYDWREKKDIGQVRIAENYMISFNEEPWRNDRVGELLSGRYVVMQPGEGRHIAIRGFELIKGAEGAKLPERATKHSAGYDFFARKDQTIPVGEIVVVWTGVKAYMPEDEVLLVFNRSSNAKKKGLILANGVGVVDADYYNNPDNEGDIGFCFLNRTNHNIQITKGEKLGQAVFTSFGVADNDHADKIRMGGYGSTDR